MPGDVLRMLLALTSFETFGAVAGPDRDPAAALPLVTGLADTVLASPWPGQVIG